MATIIPPVLRARPPPAGAWLAERRTCGQRSCRSPAPRPPEPAARTLGSCRCPRGAAQDRPPSAGACVTPPRLHPPADQLHPRGTLCTPGTSCPVPQPRSETTAAPGSSLLPPAGHQELFLKKCCILLRTSVQRPMLEVIYYHHFLTVLGLYNSEASRTKGELMLSIREGNADWFRVTSAMGPWIWGPAGGQGRCPRRASTAPPPSRPLSIPSFFSLLFSSPWPHEATCGNATRRRLLAVK